MCLNSHFSVMSNNCMHICVEVAFALHTWLTLRMTFTERQQRINFPYRSHTGAFSIHVWHSCATNNSEKACEHHSATCGEILVPRIWTNTTGSRLQSVKLTQVLKRLSCDIFDYTHINRKLRRTAITGNHYVGVDVFVMR